MTGLTAHPRWEKQGPPLTDGPGDRGAVHAEPADQDIMRGPMAEMHEHGQEPVDEDLRATAGLPRRRVQRSRRLTGP